MWYWPDYPLVVVGPSIVSPLPWVYLKLKYWRMKLSPRKQWRVIVGGRGDRAVFPDIYISSISIVGMQLYNYYWKTIMTAIHIKALPQGILPDHGVSHGHAKTSAHNYARTTNHYLYLISTCLKIPRKISKLEWIS